MKSVLAVLLLTIVCSASALTPTRPIPLDKVKVDRNLDDVLAGFKSLADIFVKTFQNALSATGNMGDFLQTLKASVAEGLQKGGEITVNLMGNLVMNTVQFAADNGILSNENAARILVTFNAPTKKSAEKLTEDEIKALQVFGDEDAAAEFREGLQTLLKNNQEQRLNILAGLEGLTMELMAGNGKVQFKGVVALKRFFNLQGLANALKHPLQSIGAISHFINGLKSKILGAVDAARTFVMSLQDTLNAKLNAAGNLSMGLLKGLVTNTLQMAEANNILETDGINRLLATYADIFDGVNMPLTASDIDNELLVMGNNAGAITKFKQTLKNLLELKTGNFTSNFALLGGLEAALLNTMAANSLMVPTGAANILNKLGLTPILNLIDSSLNLLNSMQDDVAQGVVRFSDFTLKFKAAIQEKVKAGGDLTKDVLYKALPPVLTAATRNNIIEEQDAARIEASFHAPGSSAQPLSVDDCSALTIGGDSNAASAFKQTLSGLVKIVNDNKFEAVSLVSSLAGLNVAVVDLLAINNIVGTSAALGLKNFFVV